MRSAMSSFARRSAVISSGVRSLLLGKFLVVSFYRQLFNNCKNNCLFAS